MDGQESLSEPWIGDTIFDARQKSTTKIYVVSRQINKETGHIETSKYLVRRMVQRVKGSQRETMNKWAQEKPELDKAREQRGICFYSGR